MKPSEEWARKRLGEHLAGGGIDYSSKEGENPPHFLFVVEGKEWAVEVTELHQYTDAGEEESKIATEHRLFGLFRRIDHETRKRTRGYVVSLTGPLSVEESKMVLTDAIKHVLASKDESQVVGTEGKCELTPLKADDAKLQWVIMVNGKTPDGAAMTADIQGNIDYALGRILGEKVPTLKQFASIDKRVLVIVSEYFFADSENVRIGLQNRSAEIAPIDEIYLAWDNSFEIVYP